MENKIFKTLIKNNFLGCKEYVRGRISGLSYALCDWQSNTRFANIECEEGLIIVSNCTEQNYERFIECVKSVYPDVCEFYYEM